MRCNEIWKSKYHSEKLSNKDIRDSFFKFFNNFVFKKLKNYICKILSFRNFRDFSICYKKMPEISITLVNSSFILQKRRVLNEQ